MKEAPDHLPSGVIHSSYYNRIEDKGRSLAFPSLHHPQALETAPYKYLDKLTFLRPLTEDEVGPTSGERTPGGRQAHHAGVFRCEWLLPWTSSCELGFNTFRLWPSTAQATVEREGLRLTLEVSGACHVSPEQKEQGLYCPLTQLWERMQGRRMADILSTGNYQGPQDRAAYEEWLGGSEGIHDELDAYLATYWLLPTPFFNLLQDRSAEGKDLPTPEEVAALGYYSLEEAEALDLDLLDEAFLAFLEEGPSPTFDEERTYQLLTHPLTREEYHFFLLIHED